MTNIRSTLVAALLTFGAAALASAQTTTTTPQPARAHQRGAGHHRAEHALFNGLSLSDAEKANIKSVHTKYAPQMKALREQFKPQTQAMRDARQRGDTAAVKAMWEKNSAQREQAKQLMNAERAEIRAALTPANQAKFDANVKNVQARLAKRAQKKGLRQGVKRAGSASGI